MPTRLNVSSTQRVAALAALLLVAACGREGARSIAVSATPLLPPAADKKCVVLLHGKGGGASTNSVTGEIEYLRPAGNGSGWGGREWRYFPDERYEEVRSIVAGALDAAGCGRAVVQGFSNGGAAAAKLYCRGEDFGGRVLGYLVDDPVPDSGVVGCRPRSGMQVRLYRTGALAEAVSDWSCATKDWTCEAGRTIGIERYARELGTDIVPSIHTTHAEYAAPPEVPAWLR